VSASVIQAELIRSDLNLDYGDTSPRALLDSDSSIDDPVNDTGLGPHQGDLQTSNEFTCLLRMILNGSGESS
jgi:hypothetical protein